MGTEIDSLIERNDSITSKSQLIERLGIVFDSILNISKEGQSEMLKVVGRICRVLSSTAGDIKNNFQIEVFKKFNIYTWDWKVKSSELHEVHSYYSDYQKKIVMDELISTFFSHHLRKAEIREVLSDMLEELGGIYQFETSVDGVWLEIIKENDISDIQDKGQDYSNRIYWTIRFCSRDLLSVRKGNLIIKETSNNSNEKNMINKDREVRKNVILRMFYGLLPKRKYRNIF